MSNDSHSYPIDAVILWVDGSDPKHQEKMLPFLEDKTLLSSNKFRTRFDQVNEIEFTVDSIIKFAPFIRTIFIITDEQIPSFLSNKNSTYRSKVKIVDHKVIFTGYEAFLPTFNNRPIETCMHRIPDLAEHFIYLNDDFFIINPTKPSDFFRDGLPVLRGVWTSFDEKKILKRRANKKAGHKTAQQTAAKLVGFKKYYRFRHTPHPLRKSTFKTYFDKNPEVFNKNIRHRFRHAKQFTPQGLANHIEIKRNTCHLEQDLRLLYIRSYKKPLLWYQFKLNYKSKEKLFLGLQSLDQAPKLKLDFIINWLKNRLTTTITT